MLKIFQGWSARRHGCGTRRRCLFRGSIPFRHSRRYASGHSKAETLACQRPASQELHTHRSPMCCLWRVRRLGRARVRAGELGATQSYLCNVRKYPQYVAWACELTVILSWCRPSPARRNKAKVQDVASPPQSPVIASADTSVVVSESTAVVSEPSPASIRRKRAREDDVEEGEGRAHTRARIESYVAPEGELTGLVGWFLNPIKTFMRGFQEGLSSSN